MCAFCCGFVFDLCVVFCIISCLVAISARKSELVALFMQVFAFIAFFVGLYMCLFLLVPRYGLACIYGCDIAWLFLCQRVNLFHFLQDSLHIERIDIECTTVESRKFEVLWTKGFVSNHQ